MSRGPCKNNNNGDTTHVDCEKYEGNGGKCKRCECSFDDHEIQVISTVLEELRREYIGFGANPGHVKISGGNICVYCNGFWASAFHCDGSDNFRRNEPVIALGKTYSKNLSSAPSQQAASVPSQQAASAPSQQAASAPQYSNNSGFQFVIVGPGIGDPFCYLVRSAGIEIVKISSQDDLIQFISRLSPAETFALVCHNSLNGLVFSEAFSFPEDSLVALMRPKDIRVFLYSCYSNFPLPSNPYLGQINHVSDFLNRVDTKLEESVPDLFLGRGFKELFRGIDYQIRMGIGCQKFENRNRVLPVRDVNEAYEFDVDSPTDNRGAHRIVAVVQRDGTRITQIKYLYTDNHYRSFEEV